MGERSANCDRDRSRWSESGGIRGRHGGHVQERTISAVRRNGLKSDFSQCQNSVLVQHRPNKCHIQGFIPSSSDTLHIRLRHHP